MKLAAHLPALLVAVPLLTAPVVTLLRDARLSWLATLLASTMTLVMAIAVTGPVLAGEGPVRYVMGGWPAPHGIELLIDALGALLLLIVASASTIALLGGRTSLLAQVGADRMPLFLGAWLLALAGLLGIVVSGDAFNIFVFMEISSLATYILVSGGPERRALAATFKYLITGTVGATFYLIGIGLVYMMTGTLNIEDMESRLALVEGGNVVLAAAGFITIGLALKAAVFPLHAWLPNAYTFAPHIVTVFIAACSTKVSLYVLLRMDFFVFYKHLTEQAQQFVYTLMPLAVLGILFGSTAAVFDRNVKRVLALSSIAQLGYILLGASLLTNAGFTAALLHFFNHALAKAALFLAIACLGLRLRRLRLDDVAGLGRQMPWTLAAIAVAGLSLIGVPGTAGFVSKWALILAALGEGALGVALVILIVVSSLLSVLYVGRIVECLWFGQRADDAPTVREAPIGLLAVTWLAVLANVWFGFAPGLPYDLASSGADAILRHAP